MTASPAELRRPRDELGLWPSRFKIGVPDRRVSQGVRLRTATRGAPRGEIAVVRRAFAANDETNLYVRLENATGTLPAFNCRPLWAVAIYSPDTTGNPAAATSARGFYSGRLRRPATYLVARWSSADTFAAFHADAATANGWTFTHDITGVSAPWWEPSSGTVEAVVPVRELASGPVAIPGAFIDLQVGFECQDPDTGHWYDSDFIELVHRLT